MVAAQTAEQKAAAEKAAAEKQAAEAKVAEEKAAAEKAAADASAKPETKTATKSKRYAVTGAVAVIRTPDGSERYLYRGAQVDASAFDKDSIKHLTGLGLISEVK